MAWQSGVRTLRIPSAALVSEERTQERDWILYRCFDRFGDLLYVGMSGEGVRRFFRHSEDKKWWREVTRIDLEHHPSDVEVRRAERKAIRLEKPRWNLLATQSKPLEVPILRPCKICGEGFILTELRREKYRCEKCFEKWEAERAQKRRKKT